MTNKTDNYHEKYKKIKFNSDDDLLLKKTLELYNIVRFGFHESNIYYLQLFLDACLHKLAKNNDNKSFGSMITLTFDKTKVPKNNFIV